MYPVIPADGNTEVFFMPDYSDIFILLVKRGADFTTLSVE